MKINISLQDDKQLRNEIRKMIEGQVAAIVREDLRAMVLQRSTKLTSESLEEMAKLEINRRINSISSENTWTMADNKKLEKIARQEIYKHIEAVSEKILEIASKMVSGAVAEKIDEAIQKRVETAVTNHLAKLLGGNK